VITYQVWPGCWTAYDRNSSDSIGNGSTRDEAVTELMELLFGDEK
jgi:hypothetical protein